MGYDATRAVYLDYAQVWKVLDKTDSDAAMQLFFVGEAFLAAKAKHLLAHAEGTAVMVASC